MQAGAENFRLLIIREVLYCISLPFCSFVAPLSSPSLSTLPFSSFSSPPPPQIIPFSEERGPPARPSSALLELVSGSLEQRARDAYISKCSNLTFCCLRRSLPPILELLSSQFELPRSSQSSYSHARYDRRQTDSV